ncbi:hypothetical protein LIER_41354 [Lithospermum erythrorhizon]|uniref:Uncharacterized protein n=1 Tax=Lithospermum erythrorhizon TaxID=34254 RepID=A0AAV3R815_LITER
MADRGGSSNWGSNGGTNGGGSYKKDGSVIPKEKKHVSTMVIEKIVGKDKKSSSKIQSDCFIIVLFESV